MATKALGKGDEQVQAVVPAVARLRSATNIDLTRGKHREVVVALLT